MMIMFVVLNSDDDGVVHSHAIMVLVGPRNFPTAHKTNTSFGPVASCCFYLFIYIFFNFHFVC